MLKWKFCKRSYPLTQISPKYPTLTSAVKLEPIVLKHRPHRRVEYFDMRYSRASRRAHNRSQHAYRRPFHLLWYCTIYTSFRWIFICLFMCYLRHIWTPLFVIFIYDIKQHDLANERTILPAVNVTVIVSSFGLAANVLPQLDFNSADLGSLRCCFTGYVTF